ncbi:hypothetical protein JXA32_16515 [Candidatus Sumerlaeota bacterium]|nr:hypothetical protein [Candidatus Sumerlaeota bacterium]
MAKFASNTSVNVERSQMQIRDTLRRYGAESFGVIERNDHGAVMFEFKGMTVQILVPMPDLNSDEFQMTDSGRPRKENSAMAVYEQSVRQRWRALLLAIKAKLEAVETGISTIEREFLPFIVMPDGKTFADHALPKLQELVRLGKMPKCLALPAHEK